MIFNDQWLTDETQDFYWSKLETLLDRSIRNYEFKK